jgi:transcriptional regulator with XRE-family HTH domain
MLAAARRRKRWSYRQAASRIHVVPSMLCALEQGTRAPSTVTAEAIIDAYGLAGDDAERLRAEAVPGAGKAFIPAPRGRYR